MAPGEAAEEAPYSTVLMEVARHARLLADVQKTHRRRTPDTPACRCWFVRSTLQDQRFDLAINEFRRWAVPQAREALMASLADALGWRTLRGAGKRRQFLEEVVPEMEMPAGRPREIFLEQSDQEAGGKFIRHAREEGRRHVEKRLLETPMVELTWTREFADIKVVPVPAWYAENVQEAVAEVVEGDPASTSDGDVDRFFATALGCSRESIRRGLPDEIDADPEGGDPWVKLQLLASIDEVYQEWEWARQDDASAEALGEHEPDEKALKQIADKHGYSLEELRERLRNA